MEAGACAYRMVGVTEGADVGRVRFLLRAAKAIIKPVRTKYAHGEEALSRLRHAYKATQRTSTAKDKPSSDRESGAFFAARFAMQAELDKLKEPYRDYEGRRGDVVRMNRSVLVASGLGVTRF